MKGFRNCGVPLERSLLVRGTVPRWLAHYRGIDPFITSEHLAAAEDTDVSYLMKSDEER